MSGKFLRQAPAPGRLQAPAPARPGASGMAASLAALQRGAGNQAVTKLLGREPGRALDAGTRAAMEARFGHDFSAVRIHDGPQAAEATKGLSARAFTAGAHIAFGAGRYAPGTSSGKQLLAHELAHVVQQSRGGRALPRADGTGPLESAATAAAQGSGPVAVTGASAAGVAADTELPWWKRAKQSAEHAVEAAKSAYDDPQAAYDSAKAKAAQAYDEAAGKAAEMKQAAADALRNPEATYEKVKQKAAEGAQAAWDSSDAKKKLDEVKAEWDASDTKKQMLTNVQNSHTTNEMIAAYVGQNVPPDTDQSAKAKLLRSASKMLTAAASLQAKPERAAMEKLLEGHPLDAVKAAQDAADEGLKGMKDATFDTINKWEDGEFDEKPKQLIDPTAHPDLAAAEQKLDAASQWVTKHQRQVTGGAAKAVYSMVEGIDSMIIHPQNTAEGLGKLVEMGSPLPSRDTLKEAAGFAGDILDSKLSATDAFKNLGKAEIAKHKARSDQSVELLKGLGQNYIAAAGGEIVPEKPKDPKQAQEWEDKYPGKKPGEVSMKDWRKKERIAEIPGLLLVDVGSFFIGGGEANAAVKGSKAASLTGRIGEGGEVLGKLGKLGDASDAARLSEGIGGAKGLSKAGEAGEAAKITDTAAAKQAGAAPLETPKPVDAAPLEKPKSVDPIPADTPKPPAVTPAELREQVKAAPPLEPVLEKPRDISTARGSRFGPKQRAALGEAPKGAKATPLRKPPKTPPLTEAPKAPPPPRKQNVISIKNKKTIPLEELEVRETAQQRELAEAASEVKPQEFELEDVAANAEPAVVEMKQAANAGHTPGYQAPTNMAGGVKSAKPRLVGTGSTSRGGTGAARSRPRGPTIREYPAHPTSITKVPPADALDFFEANRQKYPKEIRATIDDAGAKAAAGDAKAVKKAVVEIDGQIRDAQAQSANKAMGFPADGNPVDAAGRATGEPVSPFKSTTKGHSPGVEGVDFEREFTTNERGQPKNLTYTGQTKDGEILQIDDFSPKKGGVATEVKMPLAIAEDPRYLQRNMDKLVDQMRRQAQFIKDWKFNYYEWKMLSPEDVRVAAKVRRILAEQAPELAEKIVITFHP